MELESNRVASSAPLHPTPGPSVDEELAKATSESLTFGPAVVKEPWYAFVLPKKLHPGLYNTTLSDAPMNSGAADTPVTSNQGVPGFPEFPDFWQGETSAEQKKRTKNAKTKKFDAQNTLFKQAVHRAKSKPSARVKRQQRWMVRKAVNIPYGAATKNPGGTGKELKKRLRDQRRMRRVEKIVKLQERRRRKKDLGDISRGMASITCK